MSDLKAGLQLLVQLVHVGKQFRATPIVDDDFPAFRDKFDDALSAADSWLKTVLKEPPDMPLIFDRSQTGKGGAS